MLQLDVTFPRMGCAIMSLDAMDISGDQHLDVVSTSLLPLGPRVENAGTWFRFWLLYKHVATIVAARWL